MRIMLSFKSTFTNDVRRHKLSTLTYINFISNFARHKVRLTRKERLERQQIANSIFIHKVVNIKNASPRLQ